MMNQNCILLTTLTLLIQLKWIGGQPADLGAFGTQNDIQTGIPTYPIASQVERNLPSDIYVLAIINYTYNGEQFNEEIGKFGEGPAPQIETGKLIHITTDDDRNNHTACSQTLRGTHGEPLPLNNIPWIALVKRGHCKFDEKVQNILKYNAVAVIIYNDEDRKDLHKMRIEPQTRRIPAVFTHKEVGERMADILDEYDELKVSIVKGRLGKPIPNINRTSVLFVSISFIVLMIISFVWLVFYYVQRFRYLQTKDRKSRQLCTVAKRVIAKIPTKSIKSDESNDADSDCCAICIEPYKTTDVIRVLPCKHEFHKSCIDPWLLEHRTCPMCKMDILKHYGFVVGAQNQIINLNGFVIAASSAATAAAAVATQEHHQTSAQLEEIILPTSSSSSTSATNSTLSSSSTTSTNLAAATAATTNVTHSVAHMCQINNDQSSISNENDQILAITTHSYKNNNNNKSKQPMSSTSTSSVTLSSSSTQNLNSNHSNNSHLDVNGGCICKNNSSRCCRSHISCIHNNYHQKQQHQQQQQQNYSLSHAEQINSSNCSTLDNNSIGCTSNCSQCQTALAQHHCCCYNLSNRRVSDV